MIFSIYSSYYYYGILIPYLQIYGPSFIIPLYYYGYYSMVLSIILFIYGYYIILRVRILYPYIIITLRYKIFLWSWGW